MESDPESRNSATLLDGMVLISTLLNMLGFTGALHPDQKYCSISIKPVREMYK